MTVPTYRSLLAKQQNPIQRFFVSRTFTAGSGTHHSSLWVAGGGAAPGTTAATCDRTTTGALGQLNKTGTKTQRVSARRFRANIGSAGGICHWALNDRLAHWSGGDGTSIVTQTVNTPALTRYTTGVDVVAALEIYTALGATATTCTISYTNQDGVAGQISQPLVIGGTSNNAAVGLWPFSLAQGDTGVQSVQSGILAASTLTVGNFGITLYKPLAMYIASQSAPAQNIGTLDIGYPLPEVVDNACLFASLYIGGAVNMTFVGTLEFFEDVT